MDPDQEKTISKIIAEAWHDKVLYRRLLTDPMKVLQEAGVVLGSLIVVVVVMGVGQEATASTLNRQKESKEETVIEIVLPPKPEDLSQENLSMLDIFRRLCAC